MAENVKSNFWIYYAWLLAGLVAVMVEADNRCTAQTSCSECIRIPSCAWCSPSPSSLVEEVDKVNVHPCNLLTNMRHCPSDNLIDPKVYYKSIKDLPLTLGKNVAIPVQLRPQEVSISNLRVGQIYNITLTYTQAKDYPVDLYFLMDLSNSMKDDKANLEKLGDKMATTMRAITTEFQLGFGSFVDKKTLPFEFKPGVCRGFGPTYAFKHHMMLTKDSRSFTDQVKKASIVCTRDSPEGGLDALVQSMVCSDIGWRARARRLLVFATDARSHIAGHGRIGGVVLPNDGKCHMYNGMYTLDLEQDYPSLGQISRLAKEHSINVIFAVTQPLVNYYNQLSSHIKGSLVAELAGDSSNIVTLIEEQYKQISSSVEMRSTAPEGIHIRYYTSCLGQKMQENHQCSGLRVGDRITFIVSVEVTKCPENIANRSASFQIYPVGLNEVLKVDLTMACDCSCDTAGISGHEKNSSLCSFGGDLKCGVCQCDGLHSGQNCECTAEKDLVELEFQCQHANRTCSNRGQCICGKCECKKLNNPQEIISGKYCECDNFSCPKRRGLFCSGKGDCNCGKCICHGGWQGDDCSCRPDDHCRPIGDDPQICAGGGECTCGVCNCAPGFLGTFCQVEQGVDQCSVFDPCVLCKLFQQGPFDVEECDRKCSYSIQRTNSLEDKVASEVDCWSSYFKLKDETCRVRFVYGFGEEKGERRVRVESEPQCFKVDFLVIGLSLMGAIVAIGVALLLTWRILTFLYDKKEYARFINDTQNAKWANDSNPLYMGPTSTFQNPAFNRQSK